MGTPSSCVGNDIGICTASLSTIISRAKAGSAVGCGTATERGGEDGGGGEEFLCAVRIAVFFRIERGVSKCTVLLVLESRRGDRLGCVLDRVRIRSASRRGGVNHDPTVSSGVGSTCTAFDIGSLVWV